MTKKQELVIHPYTPRLRLKLRTLLRKGLEWYSDLSDEEELTEDEFAEGFDNYAMISVRVSGLNGEAGFELASSTDSSDELRKKFMGYLETENIQLVRELEQKIMDSDSPTNPETAPTAENLDPEV
jgi:hypothetical protein